MKAEDFLQRNKKKFKGVKKVSKNGRKKTVAEGNRTEYNREEEESEEEEEREEEEEDREEEEEESEINFLEEGLLEQRVETRGQKIKKKGNN